MRASCHINNNNNKRLIHKSHTIHCSISGIWENEYRYDRPPESIGDNTDLSGIIDSSHQVAVDTTDGENTRNNSPTMTGYSISQSMRGLIEVEYKTNSGSRTQQSSMLSCYVQESLLSLFFNMFCFVFIFCIFGKVHQRKLSSSGTRL